jgi:hypothetical protein
MQYVFRDDQPLRFRNSKRANAQQLGEAFEAAGRDPDSVVQNAKGNRKNPFYKHLEWNVERAANAYNAVLVAKIMRTITIVSAGDNEDSPKLGYISVVDGGRRARYTPEEIKNSGNLQHATLEAARRDLDAWRRRYSALTDLCEDASQMIQKIDDRLGRAPTVPLIAPPPTASERPPAPPA